MTPAQASVRRTGIGLRVAIARALLAGVVVAGSLGACGSSPCTHPPVSESPVEGVVVAVDASGLADVHGFTLRQGDGSTVVFSIGQLDNVVAFPPGHLEEHQATSVPVRVYFRLVGDSLVVYHLEDASTAPSGTAAAVVFSCR